VFRNGLSLEDFIVTVQGSFHGCHRTVITHLTRQEIPKRRDNAMVDDEKKVGDEKAFVDVVVATTVYRVTYTAYTYASLTARESGAEPIETDHRIVDLTEQQVNGNIFAAIYADLGQGSENVTMI